MPAPNANDPLRTTDPVVCRQPAAPPTGEPETLPPAPPNEDLATLSPAPAVDSYATLPPAGVQGSSGAAGLVPGYEILGKLGEGGMGVVYKARHVKLGRLVALKMILSGGHAREAELARFRTEAEAIARLQHPNIVQVYEVGEHDGKPFFSLEFCSGGSLDSKLDGTPLPPQDAARLVETLARAMHAAHEKSVIHRDLKPANVLLSEDGTPKITDFGLAKKLDDVGQTASGAIMGTPSYMAPEQAGGKSKEIGPACDVYALGAILYELLTGRPPFKSATHLDTIMQVAMDEPVSPSQLQPKTPRDLETICLKCLHKAPEKRYASAAKLAAELRRFQDGEPIEARPAGWAERGWKWAKRRPTAAALTLVSVVALLVLLVGGLWFNARLTEQRNEALGQKAQAETQLRRAEWLVYAGQLARAQSAFENNDARVALQLLEECQWDLRGWEHRHLWTRLSSKATFVGHTSSVTSVAFSPDGRRILTGSLDQTAKVWDAAKCQELFSLKGHTHFVLSVAFSPDGRRILTGSYDNTAKVWDAATGHLLPDQPAQMPAAARQATSRDGSLLVRIQDGAAVVERLTDRPRDEHPDRAALERLARFDPDFHTARLAEAENADDDFAIAFHLGQLLRHLPWAADLLVKQAHLFARQEQPQQAALILTRALLLNTRVAFADLGFAARGDRAARAGNWTRAVFTLRIMVEQPGASPLLRSNLLLAELAAGDAEAARRTAGAIVAALLGQGDAVVAAGLQAWLSAAPLSEADAAKWEQHARQAVVRQRNTLTLHSHGVALYRAGKHEEAARVLAESVKASAGDGSAETWLFQALAAQKQGQHAEALGLLARYEIWHRQQTFADWRQRALNQLLLAEAQREVNAKPAVPAKE